MKISNFSNLDIKMATSTLPYIQSRMNFYGYPILLVPGDIGNIFILILFLSATTSTVFILYSTFNDIKYGTFNN